MDKVLVLSEDERASGFLGTVFQREHFLPILSNRLTTAQQQICTLQSDALIIDVPLAEAGAFEICMQLHAWHIRKPAVILGESDDEMDKVLALEAGADYYIAKPFAHRELLARLRALLRRRRANDLDSVIRFGSVEVNREHRTVTCHGKDIKMTPCEYKLLLFFLSNADLALTRERLLNSVWGYSQNANTRTLDAHVSKLRNKCERDPGAPRHFLTVHGVGYRFLM